MRALVWHGPGRMSVDELPEPVAGPGEVVLVPEAAGICGSDVEGYTGAQGNRTPPLVMNHELGGRVAGVGAGVDVRWRGRRAAVNPLVPGDEARPGIEQLSRRRELIGVHRPGGFRERRARARRAAARAARAGRRAARRSRRAAGQRGSREPDRPAGRRGRAGRSGAVMIGLATDATPVGFHAVVREGLTVRGSYAYTAHDYDEALALLVDGRAGLGELEAVQPLDAGPEAFAELATGPSPRLKVFLAADPR